MNKNHQKVALITGGSRGIGKAIATRLAQDGFNIIITYVSDKSRQGSEEFMKELENDGIKAQAFQCDSSSYNDVAKFINKIKEDFGRIDVLVNNAGITRDGLIIAMDQKQFLDVINVNLNGVFYMTKYVSKMMIRARQGSIINISSVVGVSGNAGQVNYAAAKAGVIGLSKTVAKELGKRNIRCNAIAPGFIKTNMTKKLSEKLLQEVTQASELKRLGEPQDVANLVSFLASDDSSFITGQVINVDGGLLI